MIERIKLSKDEILPLLNQLHLDKNLVESVEELNFSMESIHNIGNKTSFRVYQGLLEIIGGFNSIPRKLCVDISDGKVYVNLIDLIKSILSYKGVIIVDYDVRLIKDVSMIRIELPFLKYSDYYPIYQRDYLKYAKVPEELKKYLKFKSIVNYIGEPVL